MEDDKVDKIVLNDSEDNRNPPKPPKSQGRAIPGINYGVDIVTDKIKTGDEEKEKEFRPYAPHKRNDQGSSFDGSGSSDGGSRQGSERYEGSRQGSERYEGSRQGSEGSRQGTEGYRHHDRDPSRNRRRMEPQLNSPNQNQAYDDEEDAGSQGSMSIYSDESFNDYIDEPEEQKPKLTYEQIRSRKIEGLAALKRLEDQGYEAAGKKCGLTSSLEEIEEVLEKLRAQRDLDNSIKFQRDILVTFVGMVEYGCSIEDYNIFDLDLNGWSKAVFENITDYDEVFEELHYKYKTSMAIAPELKLLGMLSMSGYRYHLSRQMISKAAGTVPGFNDVMNADPELRRRYQDTAGRMAQKNGMPAGPPPSMMQMPSRPKQMRTPMNDPDDVDGLLASIKGKKNNSRMPAEMNLSEIDMNSNV